MNRFSDIKPDSRKGKHLYEQIAYGIIEKIEEGKFPEGEALPSIKKLATFLKVNPATIVKAYEILEKEDFVEKRRGSGTFVKDREKEILNFASGTPSYDFFPIKDFKVIINDVLDYEGAKIFEYTEGQGDQSLRRALCEYVEKYDILCNEKQIHVISGAQQGIDLIIKGLVEQGDPVLIERPSYTGAIGAFQSRGALLEEIPIKNDGLDLKALEAYLQRKRPKLLYAMPNFQNPTGISYSTYKKRRLLELAKIYDFYILEDDYLSDLNFYSKDSRTLKSLDSHNKVIYLKSFSKIFMPGLRLGFLILPEELQDAVLEAKLISDISTSGLLQKALKEYMIKGMWEKHIEGIRKMYSKRFQRTLEVIQREIPEEIKVQLPKGGMNFWFSLPEGFDETAFYRELEKQKIRVAPGAHFFLTPPQNPCFRLSIANVDGRNIEKGLRVIGKLFNEALKIENEKGNRSMEDLIL